MNNTSPEVLEKWLKEFEELYAQVNPSKKFNRSPDGYHQPHAQQSWFWFRLSRQAAVIELPDRMWKARALSDGFNDCLDASKKLIESQGYQVKTNEAV